MERYIIAPSSINISAAAAKCDLLHHVKTQIPYALVPAGLAIIGYLLIGFAYLSPWICLLIGIAILVLIIKFFGKSTDFEKLSKENK